MKILSSSLLCSTTTNIDKNWRRRTRNFTCRDTTGLHRWGFSDIVRFTKLWHSARVVQSIGILCRWWWHHMRAAWYGGYYPKPAGAGGDGYNRVGQSDGGHTKRRSESSCLERAWFLHLESCTSTPSWLQSRRIYVHGWVQATRFTWRSECWSLKENILSYLASLATYLPHVFVLTSFFPYISPGLFVVVHCRPVSPHLPSFMNTWQLRSCW